ncbi:nucleoside-diphosphate-sugar epimerase [Moraxella osloensis]|uniref:UDP-glucose 4-epimerase n=1 Tax=Faucicola osloensis TaxID=34062 RepID=A0A378Q8Y8_FAUOS|nr:NAD-dependent epimerase/dehydratase family protein [Moraxella osloensis]AME00673.1 dehydratase [Moraxella osloensis]OBX54942.1 nucleoside-diphosphate-sugar epimerase [Moraxella osloensis]QPT41735.1 NAD-dependent epimerase/dehydratase family protein [Moraxella osloensis]STY97313.1 UDP-glucose 4-epimerase [Moraxella osloensis]
MRIIFTGLTGFVGKNLRQHLISKSNKVIPLSLRSGDYQLDNTADAIIHLAGKAHDTKNSSDDNEYYRVNTDLTIALFDKFLQSDIKDFIFFSSVKAAADSVEGTLTEDSKANPQTAYGKSKLKAETYLLSKQLPSNKRLIIIRPCMIHGEGNKGNLNLLYQVVKYNVPWILAAYENRRSFISIDNLNYVVYEILNHPKIPSGIYNIADDKPMSTNGLISLIAESINKKPRLLKIPKFAISQMAKIGDKAHLPLNTERLQKLTESYVVSNQKIKQSLGIDTLPLTVEQGLTKTIKSFDK